MPLTSGQRLGPYEIVGALGAGGMGEVYRARDPQLNRDVAIKVLLPSVAGDPERLTRFHREAQVLASLNHPNIAHIHGLQELSAEAGSPAVALVMELVEGPTLADRIARGPIPLDEALSIAKQIAEALEAAHEQGVIHRDLKPANIKVRPDGMVKVLDFGLAKAIAPLGAIATADANIMNSPTLSNHATLAGTILGTAAYMSPEQAAGKPVDKRTDLWAFGVVLFEMLTSRQAFAGETATHVMAAVLTKHPDWTALPAATPTPMRRLLRRCLEKDRRRRIADASDARLDLEEIGPAESRDDEFGAMPVVGGAVGWRRRLPWALAGILAVSLASALVLWAPWRTVSDARLLKLSIVPPDRTAFRTMAISPDGRMLAFTAREGSGRISLWVRPLDSLTAHVLPSTDGADFPFWSPDSRFVGYSTHGGLYKIAVAGGPPQRISSLRGARGAAWGRNGTIVFTTDTSAPLQKISADGSAQAAPLTSLDTSRGELSHRWPSFLPDGRHYIFTVRGGQRDAQGIYVGSLDSSVRTRLTGDLSNGAYAESSTGASYLLFARGRGLLAQPFDVDALRLTGDPIVVDDNVSYSAGWALAAFSVSQTGVLVFDSANRSREAQLALFDRTGARGAALGEFYSTRFSFSPDGTRVVLQSVDPQTLKTNLWTVDLARGITTRFSPGVEHSQHSPAWSPDGARIAFTSEGGIFERRSNGGGTDSLLLKGDSSLAVQDWSRDGRFLLYRRVDPTTTKGHLWVIPMSRGADKTAFQVVNSQLDQVSGTISPDGKWIAYESVDESGTHEVFVQAFSGSESSGRSQVSKGGGLRPQWRGDGRELFFLAADRSGLMSVPVTPGDSFDAGPPAMVFAGRFDTGLIPHFSVSPDGRRFLISVPMSAEGSSPATVILNWIAVLKK